VIRRLVVVALLVGTTVAGQHVVSGAHVTEPPPRERQAAPVAPMGVGDTSHLTPALQRAVRRAIAAAAADGVELRVTSGWRSPRHQQELFAEAVRKYGSPEAASHWVLPPARSAHVRGEAVDVGPAAGAHWLEEHGVRFGLCRRYDNEYWHFELLAAAKGSDCPTREAHA
jgi:LAS superfamily LD-carboxypeptidase LdcB